MTTLTRDELAERLRSVWRDSEPGDRWHAVADAAFAELRPPPTKITEQDEGRRVKVIGCSLGFSRHEGATGLVQRQGLDVGVQSRDAFGEFFCRPVHVEFLDEPEHVGEHADECPTCAPNHPRVGGRYEATLAGRVEAIRVDGFLTIKWDGCEGAASALSPTEVAAATWVELTPPDYPDGWYGWTSPPGYEQVLLRRDREWIWPLTGAVQAVGSGDVFRRLPS